MEDHNLRTAVHAPDSLDLAPSDFFFFGHVKRTLQGKEFQSTGGRLHTAGQIVTDIPADTLMATFHQWTDGLQACLHTGGEFVE
jgi:hypothetical protein